jgi:MtN3 and saliva related transmembrane protein
MNKYQKKITGHVLTSEEISKANNNSKPVTFYKNQKFIKICEKLMTLIGLGGQTLFYLQAYKIYSTQCAASVSLAGFSIATLSVFSWILYGLLIRNSVLIIVNTFALVGAILTLLAIFMVN